MSDIERRLQHAGRELRGIEIEPPPLGPLGALGDPRRRTGAGRRIPALVMPALFVLGGLAVLAGGIERRSDAPEATSAVEIAVESSVVIDRGTTGDSETGSSSSLTAHQELALISSLGPGRTATPTAPAPPDVRTLASRYR